MLISLFVAGLGSIAMDPIQVTVHADKPGVSVSKSLYGVFFEEINHAGDGGLNPELIRNFNFNEPTPEAIAALNKALANARSTASPEKTGGSPPGWEVVGGHPIMGRGQVELARTSTEPDFVGIRSRGYWGIPLKKGERYRYEVDCASVENSVLTLRLRDADGDLLAEASVVPQTRGGVDKGILTPTRDSADACLEIGLASAGEASLSSVSLRPVETWQDHGLRTDLAEMVDAVKPSFVRFPGGCYVEGGDYLRNRFKWDTTLAPAANRPGHLNDIWHYWSTDGLGYHEYLQWCEDMGSDALFVVNCGISHKEVVPMSELASYVDSALDAIEYALGPPTSRMGTIRSKRGHPAPFPLKYVEIGNENGMGWTSGGTPTQYAERFAVFEKAIRQRYPQLKIIADNRTNGGPYDFVDDHFYNSPDWFWRNTGLYDRADRDGPEVYVGEYAVTSDCGHGNLRAALAESAWLTGIERNGDVVRMASYAPLFVNANDRAWNPDAICFDGSQSFGTPSYYVQKLFSANRPDIALPVDYPKLEQQKVWGGGIGLGTWLTSAEYKDIEVTAGGKTLYKSDLSSAVDWKADRGDWSVVEGAYRQRDFGQEETAFLQAPALDGVGDYSLRVKARKLGGAEGFLILFRAKDSRTFYWWNIGGWGNQQTGVEVSSGGGRSGIGRRIPYRVETGKWYDISIATRGDTMELSIDGKHVQTVRAVGSPTLAVGAGTTKSGEVILKLVNRSDEDRPALISLDGLQAGPWQGTATVLTADSLSDENSFAEPLAVAPKSAEVSFATVPLSYTIPARSLVILRLKHD